MKKLNKVYVTSALALVFSVWVIWQAGSIPMKFVSNEPGPRLFPYISAIGIIICSVLSIFFDGIKNKNRGQEKNGFLDKDGWKRMGIIILELILFAVLMQYLGFLIAAIVMMFVFIWTMKGAKKISIPFAVILSVALSLIVYFGFTKGFVIPLPSGSLWEALGIKMPF